MFRLRLNALDLSQFYTLHQVFYTCLHRIILWFYSELFVTFQVNIEKEDVSFDLGEIESLAKTAMEDDGEDLEQLTEQMSAISVGKCKDTDTDDETTESDDITTDSDDATADSDDISSEDEEETFKKVVVSKKQTPSLITLLPDTTGDKSDIDTVNKTNCDESVKHSKDSEKLLNQNGHNKQKES